MGKNNGKNVRGEYNQKLVDNAKQSATDRLKIASNTAVPKNQSQLVI